MRKWSGFCQPVGAPQMKRAAWKAGVTSQCKVWLTFSLYGNVSC